ncbi:long-chain fatty acid--CoA ligase [Sporomusa acidovorans]|uniref:acyl-CoA synthetase n=1 Tax=Sporomusa acidovorans TaxID=112900 RepID=UPI0035A1BC91
MVKRAQLSHGKVALVFNQHKLTYDQFNSRINRLANGLVQTGVQKGDRIAVFLMNGNEILEAMFACAKIGAIFVPINFRLSLEEVEYILNDSGATVFFYQSEFVLLASEIRKRVPISCWISVGSPVLEDDIRYEDFLLKYADQEPEFDVPGEDVHMILYTSGTTGRPKGAMLTHANTFWNITQILLAQPILEEDITLTVAPLFHSGALTILTLTLLYRGGTVIIKDRFDPVQVLQTIQQEKITCMFMVPSMWLAVTQVPDFYHYNLRSLRFGISAGSPCPLTIIKILKRRRVPLIQAFGLSEVAPVAILGIQDCMRKIGSVGKGAFYVDIRIINKNGREALVKEVGELVVHAPNVMSGYWKKPQATREVLQNGWFFTGDCVWRDEEGYLYVAGRKKDVIITGGENVYPVEVEQVLDRHPNIAEAAVVGVPNEKWGEIVKAVIVLKDSSQELSINRIKTFCEGKLARFKVPKILEFVSALPRNAAGKVLKDFLQ